MRKVIKKGGGRRKEVSDKVTNVTRRGQVTKLTELTVTKSTKMTDVTDE